MNELKHLQQQIDELKETVKRLNSGETKFVAITHQAHAKRKEIFDRHFGKWIGGETMPQIGNNSKPCITDRNELLEGIKRLTNTTYKTAHDEARLNINTAIKNGEDLEDYAKIFEFYCQKVSEEIQVTSQAFREKKAGRQ